MRFILLLLLTGCATTQGLSPEAGQVRTVPTSFAASCQHLGMVQAFQPALVGGLSAAHVAARKKVALRGGNALTITAQTVDRSGHGEVLGDAYACSF
jgi:hypothetical protein